LPNLRGGGITTHDTNFTRIRSFDSFSVRSYVKRDYYFGPVLVDGVDCVVDYDQAQVKRKGEMRGEDWEEGKGSGEGRESEGRRREKREGRG
jgi:hypothetical protein